MGIEEVKKAAVVNRGDLYRLKTCIRRAMAGETLRIGFFGGSITQGSLASSDKTCYAWLVYQWWAETFPQAEFEYINGGIGGTSSLYGAARVQKDLLAYGPDFVIVDFSVNDEPTEFFKETYEGLLRKLLGFSEKMAVLLLHNVYYDSGKNAQKQHVLLGRKYGLPCISIKNSVYPMILNGDYSCRELTEDGLHPNDCGHALLALMITSFLEEIYQEVKEEGQSRIAEQIQKIGEPLTENAYENVVLLQNRNLEPELNGFQKDLRPKEHRLDLFKNGWTGQKAGDSMSCSIECSCLAIQYLKSVKKPVPAAYVIIDGDKEHAVFLDGNFEETWGDCLFLQSVLHHAERKKYTIEIQIVDSEVSTEPYVRPFYLVAVLYS